MGGEMEAAGRAALPGGERVMIREIVEAGVILGLAICGVAVAIYNHDLKQSPVQPNVVHVIPVPVETPAPPPPPPAPSVVEPEAGSAQVSEEGEMPLQRDPPPRALKAIDTIEQRLLKIQERIDRIEKKASEDKK